MLAAGAGMTARAASENMIQTARRHKVSGGTWEQENGKTYYRKKPTKKKPKGERLRNTWVRIDGSIYYFNRSGALEYGRFKYQGQRYISDPDTGEVFAGELAELEDATYAVKKDGTLGSKEWVRLDSYSFYCNAYGRVVTNRWIGDRYAGVDGAALKGVNRKKISKNATVSEQKMKQRLIIVGASRVCDMRDATRKTRKFTYKGKQWNTVFICCRGAGFDWFHDEAIAKLRAYLDLYPRSKVVVQMGNNDVYHVEDGRLDEYAELYQKLMRRYPKASFYFMDVLPSVDPDKNEKRQTYNEVLKTAFPKQWIGGYEFLMELPFRPREDGVHYRPSTSRAIFEYIRKMVGLK